MTQIIRSFADKPYERTFLFSLPFTTREALEVRPRAVKVTSPVSSGITVLILRVYFRPALEALNLPPLSTFLPFSVQLNSSMLSWDKTHSKVQSSPSWISVLLSRLVMPMFSSGEQKLQLIQVLNSFMIDRSGVVVFLTYKRGLSVGLAGHCIPYSWL